MPDLGFQIKGLSAAEHGITPMLQFLLEVKNADPSETIEAVALQAQIQIQCPQRHYNAAEKERLSELFGTPDRWGETLRNRLWTHVHTTVRSFTGSTEALLPVPCTYDLKVNSAKYFHALEGGDVGLLFLFSGTIFYRNTEGLLQVAQIPWHKECGWRMPVARWREMMDHHYPNGAWVDLNSGLYERLYEYRRRHHLAAWDEVIENLLQAEEVPA